MNFFSVISLNSMVTLAHRCPSSVKVRPLTRCFTNRAADKGIRTVLVVRIITSVSSRRESWCERAISYWNFTNVSLPKHWADNWTGYNGGHRSRHGSMHGAAERVNNGAAYGSCRLMICSIQSRKSRWNGIKNIG